MHDKIKILLYLSIVFISFHSRICDAEITTKGYSLKKKVYSVDPIPFQRKDITLPEYDLIISFDEYGKQAKPIYPIPGDRTSSEEIEKDVIKKCLSTIKLTVDKIVKMQSENIAIQNYLFAYGEIFPFAKDDYINLIKNPEEQTIQIDPQTQNIIAEFRSSQIPIDDNKMHCLYLTFVYSLEKKQIGKIIISAIELCWIG